MLVSSRIFDVLFHFRYILSGQEMERAQARGDVDEEELRALEMDVTGKVDLNANMFYSLTKALIIVNL